MDYDSDSSTISDEGAFFNEAVSCPHPAWISTPITCHTKERNLTTHLSSFFLLRKYHMIASKQNKRGREGKMPTKTFINFSTFGESVGVPPYNPVGLRGITLT